MGDGGRIAHNAQAAAQVRGGEVSGMAACPACARVCSKMLTCSSVLDASSLSVHPTFCGAMTIAPSEPVQLHHRMGACGAAFLQVLETLVAGGRGGDAAHLQAVLRRLAGGAHPGEPGCGGGGGSPKAGARHPDAAVLVSLLLQLRVRTRVLTRRSHAVTTPNSCNLPGMQRRRV